MALAAAVPSFRYRSRLARWRPLLLAPPVQAWLVHLVIVFAAAAITAAATSDRDGDRQRFSGLEGYLVSPLSTWDGGWYVHLAESGYGRQEQSAAFWPLYPLLLDAGYQLTHLPYATIGVILSTAALLPGLIALFALVRADYGSDIATRAVWLAALSPLAFFFSAVYTEALFLLLTVGALALARSGRWTWAALAASLASLTRSGGILIFLPLGMMMLRQSGWHPGRWWTQGIQLAVAACAPLAFAWHLQRLRGDPLLMIHVQKQWGRTAGAPWETLARAYRLTGDRYADGSDSCSFGASFEAVGRCRAGLMITTNALSDDLSIAAMTGVLVLLPYAIWRLLPRDSVYLAVGIAVPLLSPATEDPLQSIARFLIVLYPIYIVLAKLLSWRPLLLAVLAGSTIALACMLAVFAQWYFVA